MDYNNEDEDKKVNEIVDKLMEYYVDGLKNKNINKDYRYYSNKHKNVLCSDKYEGNRNYAYLDSANKPNVTIGCGLNVDANPKVKLINRHTGEELTNEQKQNEIANLRSKYIPNYKAEYYKDKSVLGINSDEHDKYLLDKYKNIEREIKTLKNNENFTEEQMNALYDIGFNVGSLNRFPKMKKAINENNWYRAAKESHRKNISSERNCITANNLYPNFCKNK